MCKNYRINSKYCTALRPRRFCLFTHPWQRHFSLTFMLEILALLVLAGLLFLARWCTGPSYYDI